MKDVHDFAYRMPLLLMAAIFVTACTSANPMAISFADPPYTDEKVSRGVVNGFWEYDPAKNKTRLKGAFAKAGDELAKELADRHLVRVGINRSYFVGRFLDVVALPEGWTYSLEKVVDDGRTINVGDVVDVRGHIGTNVEAVIAIVRKCSATPVPDENKDWSIGCKRIETFDASGYGGDKQYLSVF
jgi:hypothetical protein